VKDGSLPDPLIPIQRDREGELIKNENEKCQTGFIPFSFFLSHFFFVCPLSTQVWGFFIMDRRR
jgi:hypothetical protein